MYVLENVAFECNNISSHNTTIVNEFDNGLAHLALDTGAGRNGEKEAIVTSDGEMEILSMPESQSTGRGNWIGGKVSEGAIVFMEKGANTNAFGYESIAAMCYYDLESGTFISMDQYVDKMYRDIISDMELHFSDDRIVIPLIGDDYFTYIAIFDKEWNEVMKPIKVFLNSKRQLSYMCGRLIVNLDDGNAVLDEMGNVIVKACELGCETISPYSNNVAKIGEGKYIDKNGKLLFENIDANNVKQ